LSEPLPEPVHDAEITADFELDVIMPPTREMGFGHVGAVADAE